MDAFELENPDILVLTTAMRNDLTDMFAVAHLLDRRVSDAEGEMYLLTLQDKAYSLLRSLTNLELANLKGIPLNNTIDVTKLLESAARCVTTLCGRDMVVCEAKLPLGRLALQCDVYHLQHALYNILRNSVQHVREDVGISIKAYRWRKRILIKIADKGIGIRNGVVERVCEPFFSVDPYGDSLIHLGAGNGLYVAQKLLNLHGGTMALNSEFGKGTTVSISLPLAQAAECQQVDFDQQLLNRYSPLFIHFSDLLMHTK